ncbi:MAG TPA: AAA family ATPase [bacterium]|nr:AAA family ATPase [bacterium]
MTTKKILYGVSNFEKIRELNGYYIDKSKYIETIENLGASYLLFLRPRRFGKSLFISMLEHYYDINKKDQFEELFRDLYIGKNPTPLRNSFPILKLNFSGVITNGTVEEIERSFNMAIRDKVRSFYERYQTLAGGIDVFQREFENIGYASDILRHFIELMSSGNIKYYLLIDEYDNFANNILAAQGETNYANLTHGDGFLRNFFTVIKMGTDTRAVERMFATGVSPLVMSDVTSGFNIGENISLDSIFAGMVGFTQEEVGAVVDYFVSEGVIPVNDREKVLETMEKNYNNYCFSVNTGLRIYNSNSVMYLIHQYTKSHEMPTSVIDTNMRTDYQKMRFLVLQSRKLNGNFNILSEILLGKEIESELKKDFPIKEIIQKDFFVSFLYYLGFITIKKQAIDRFLFEIPNDMCREILWEYIRKAMEESFEIELAELSSHYSKMTRKGEWRGLLEYIFSEFYQAASNRDFIYREEGVKGFLLAYLNISKAYRIHSEPEMNKGYADIFVEPNLLIFPEMDKTHLLIELKYLKKEEATESMIKKCFEEAKTQLEKYAKDKKAPRDAVKVVAITTNEELLILEEV